MKDYKEKYEQAIERAKVINPGTADYEVAVKIFPELKESEDEKIRKELISLFQDGIDGVSHRYSGSDCSRWLAWLEKQGVLKPAGKTQVSEKLYEHIRNTCACIDDALSSETLVDVKDYLEMASVDAQSAFDMIEKLGEQKPAEWSENDEYLLELSLENLAELKNRFGEKYGKVGECIYWLKFLKKRMIGVI